MPGKPPYYRRFPRDIDADGVCEAMTAEQFGVYNRLLDKAWFEEPGGTVPDDDAVLARWGRITLARWRKIMPGVMAAFVPDGGRWRQKRMAQDHAELADELDRKSRGGKRSAELRSQHQDSSNTLGKTLGNLPPATCASASGYESESLSSPNGEGGAGEGVGPPSFDLTPEGIAQEWCHVHRGGIASQRDPYKTAEEFREWIRVGVSPDALRAAVCDPSRDRTEATFQLKSRLVPKAKTAGPAAESMADKVARHMKATAK